MDPRACIQHNLKALIDQCQSRNPACLEPGKQLRFAFSVGGDSDENVRGFALRALAATGGQEAMLALGRILFGDPNPDTRLQALRALASSKSPVAQSFVDKAADDPDVMVRTAANEAITRWQ